MSRIFYDHFIVLEDIEFELNQLDLDREEREEINQLIEEIIHYRILQRILTHLPRHHHAEFLEAFHRHPHDPNLLDYIDHRIEESIEAHLKDEIKNLKKEILEEIHPKQKDHKNHPQEN